MPLLTHPLSRRSLIALGIGLALAACGGAPSTADQGAHISLMNASYDVTRDFYKAYNPLFVAEYQQQSDSRVSISQSHGGSTKQTLAVANGLQADVVTMNQSSDINLLVSRGLVNPDWAQQFPNGAMPYTSTSVFLVRKGNPKKIHEWADLVDNQAQVLFANPKTSGSGRYAFLAAYASALKAHDGDHDAAKAFMSALFKNIPVLDGGGRAATTTFVQRQIGDVLIAPENEAQLAVREFGQDAFEVVYPSDSIVIESPVAVVTKVAQNKGTTAAATAYLQGLWREPAQTLAAQLYLRPQDPAVLAAHAAQFPDIERFLAQDVFGSWDEIMRTYFADGGVLDQISRP
ncbi:MAG: sulfate ABC transporter substrate-binding protein [Neisseriaceae bacterium]|nr:sulfate ABC transporter substrate-binding protein [Neisseriaceae bacterium]MBP6861197.1 sulfate ABC transporter substrate-binding protein [Neisseriaceae bacterium]